MPDVDQIRRWIEAGFHDPVGAASTARAYLNARVRLRNCKHVGVRPRIHGDCRVSGAEGIEIGDRFLMFAETVRGELSTHAGGRLVVGDGVFMNYGTSISAHTLVKIGSNCRIGQYAILLDCDFHGSSADGTSDDHGTSQPIVLEDDVWLAARVIVLKGVTIGKGSVIAAGSVVSHDVPPGVLAGGVPAKVIRPRP